MSIIVTLARSVTPGHKARSRSRHVFGPEAAEFKGEEWVEELRRRGLLGLH
jgi:hypothetical protein